MIGTERKDNDDYKYTTSAGPFMPVENETAPQLLRKASEIMEERGKTYDSEGGERSMLKTVMVFNTITGHELMESDGWLFMQLLKDVRQWTNSEYHADSAEDCIAYSALKAEALAKEG